MIAWLAVQKGNVTLTEVGKRFGRDVATLSTTIRRLIERAERIRGIESTDGTTGINPKYQVIKA